MEKKYNFIKQTITSKETPAYWVREKKSRDDVGSIFQYGGLYVFKTSFDLIFTADDLREIAAFIESLAR